MTYQELTTDLSDKNSQALLICPVYIGGDSVDMETFIEDVWRQPVTDSNYRQVAQAFRTWFAEVAPTEYHPPLPTVSLLAATSPNGRPPIGEQPGRKRSLHATDADWEWLGMMGGGSQAEGLRRLRQMHGV